GVPRLQGPRDGRRPRSAGGGGPRSVRRKQSLARGSGRAVRRPRLPQRPQPVESVMPAWAWLAAGIFYACVVLFVMALCRAAAIGDQQAERAHAEHERRQAEEWEAA